MKQVPNPQMSPMHVQKSRERTIARDIAIKLCAWMAAGVALAGLALFFYQTNQDRNDLRRKTVETANQIAQIMGQPIWTFNETEIKSTVNAYMLSDSISAIRVFDEDKKPLYSKERAHLSQDIRAAAQIVYRDKKLGRVEVLSSTSSVYRAALKGLIGIVCLVSLAILIAILVTTRLLHRHLETPLLLLGTAIKKIAAGSYNEKLPHSPQLELNRIAEEVNFMADKISIREHQIRQNIQQQTILKAEINIAETVQRSMVASRSSSSKKRVAQFYQPMNNLSGDWMTIMECQGGRVIYAMVGDVTGHGIPQGLVTMAAFGAIQTLRPLIQQNHQTFTPATIMNILRATMMAILNECNLAMTVAILKIDLEKRELRVCNAGHTFPLVLSKEEEGMRLRPITAKPQSPFGYELLSRTVANISYTDLTRPLGPREMICLYTDGLVDARNMKSSSYQRSFLHLLKKMKNIEPPQHLMDRIVDSLQSHLNGANADDDICLMLIDTSIDVENEHAA